ncbi:hypothetical protein [Streptomyces sp. NRRL F-2747]|uniref:hypothetical protein n=1 Tax=Streptomyces sp. NRRL F-2747 TaxID=1463843 RepID=UPI000A7800DB|nr:hypothetical protein [Streptomyces sp. NRRL F-2747]
MATTRPLTPAQRDLFQAFVDTDQAAGSIGGNASWFRAAGLPANLCAPAGTS